MTMAGGVNSLASQHLNPLHPLDAFRHNSRFSGSRNSGCFVCGELLPLKHSARGRPRKTCSRLCRERLRQLEASKQCLQCGKAHGNLSFCSLTCFANWRRRTVLCGWCTAPFLRPRNSRGRLCCSAKCSAAQRVSNYQQTVAAQAGEKTCPNCGSPARRRFCSDKCRDSSKRRARRAAYAEPYSFAEIYARDGGLCQLCGTAIDLELKHPHPESMSIDHVFPIIAGGPDTPENVQLAHMGCNSAKGAKLQLSPVNEEGK